MKLRWEKKQAILKQRKERKSIRAIAYIIVIANTTICNVLKKKGSPGALTTRYGWPKEKKQQQMKHCERGLKKTPKQQLSPPTYTGQGYCMYHNPMFEEDFKNRNTVAIS